MEGNENLGWDPAVTEELIRRRDDAIRTSRRIWWLYGLFIAAGLAVFLPVQALVDTSSRGQLTANIKTMLQGINKDVALLQQRVEQGESTNAEVQGELSVVTKRLRLTQGELKQAKQEAAQIREDNATKLAAMDTAVKTELATK